MTAYFQWIEQHSALFAAFCIVGLTSSALFNAWRRRKAGPIHPPIDSSEVLFSESQVSGYSDKNLFTKLGGASKVLVVTVLKGGIIIEPMSLFKWGMPRGFNDLEHYIRKSDIVAIDPGSSFGRKTIELRFKANDNSTRTISLVVRNSDALVAALRAPAS